MIIDIALVALILLVGRLGMDSGATRELSHWAGLGLGYGASRPVAGKATHFLSPYIHHSPVAIKVALSTVFFYVLYALGGHVVQSLIIKVTGPYHEDSKFERIGGFILGAGKGAVMLFVVLSALIFFEKPIEAKLGPAPNDVNVSVLVRQVRKYNLFDIIHLPAFAKVKKLLDAARDPYGERTLADEPELQKLLKDPALKSALQDDSVASALRSGDAKALAKDPRLAAILKDLE